MERNQSIGLDIGYGVTKIYCGVFSGKFPTAVTQMVPQAAFASLHPVIVEGSRFLVGNEAAREGKGLIDTRTTTFVSSKPWLAIAGHALSLAGASRNDVLVLGVPPGKYTKSYAAHIAEGVRSADIVADGNAVPMNGLSVKVIPQGAGIFFAHTMTHPSDFQKGVAIVDFGHYTLDMLYFAGGKYVEGATRSVSMGISMFLDEVVRAFYTQHGLTITHEQAVQIFDNGHIVILDEPYSVRGMDEILAPYVAQVSSMIDGFFENLPKKPEVGVVGGGGALALKGRVSLRYKLHIAQNPDMANAVGYQHYGTNSAR